MLHVRLSYVIKYYFLTYLLSESICQVRNCRLVGLLDLNLSSSYVRGKVMSYLNRLIDLGVAGFRVDAVKHMWAQDLQPIYDNINDLSTDAGFAAHTRPFIFNEASFFPRTNV